MDPAEPHDSGLRSRSAGVARAEADRAPQQGRHPHINAHIKANYSYTTIDNPTLLLCPTGAEAGGGLSPAAPPLAATSFARSSGCPAFRTRLLSVS